ncbi:MAG: 30S ribosome-binding factor RbfA [Candidatus Omnitrophica bacterium]|nr:30S ribosome-binding factor RbfA [Candidatus Omnitrophota bacterium]
MSLRMEKINSEIQKQLMDIIQKEIDDPSIGVLSITRVDTTSDLRECKIYFSLLDETKYDRVTEIFKAMNAFIRMHLGKRIKIKILPELKFIQDTSIKYSVDMYTKIEEIRRQDKEKEAK